MNKQVQEIRSLVNKPLIQSRLIQNTAIWNQLCSSLDVIEDSNLAIKSYPRLNIRDSSGDCYLVLYGLLQALFIQQNAVEHLCESLKIRKLTDDYPRLKEIKGIRNDSSGHPTKRGSKNKPSYHFISRVTLNHAGFKLLSTYYAGSNKSDRVQEVIISDLIKDQRECISKILDCVAGELKQREKDHKEKFKVEKLISFLPDNLNYRFEKVICVTRVRDGQVIDSTDLVPGQAGLEAINKSLKKLKNAIAKRGVNYDVVGDLLELIDYSLSELEVFLQQELDRVDTRINRKTAFIFAFFVQKKFEELKEIAKEIDEEYSNY